MNVSMKGKTTMNEMMDQEPTTEVKLTELKRRVDYLARIKAIRAKLSKRDDKLMELEKKHKGELIKILEAADLDNFHGSEFMVYLVHKDSWKTPKTLEDKKKFFDYVRSLGEEQFYTWLGINSQSLQTFCKEQQLDEHGNLKIGFQVPGIEPSTTTVDLNIKKKQ